MKISIVGHFAKNQNLNDGQTIKTRNIYKELEKTYKEDVSCIDTYNYKAHPFKLLKKCANAIKTSDYLIILPGMNGIKLFVPLFIHLNKKHACKIIYVVVGGWLPEFLISKKSLQKKIKQLDLVLVETNTMKKKLNKIGITNVDILFNFKDIKPLDVDKLKNTVPEIYKVCTFSRVIKEKGIENAIKVVENINQKYNKTIYCLDVYGPIAPEYKEEFEKIINDTKSNCIKYKGVVDSNKSVDTIKNYDLLLFPTYYKGEGLAGTIIDAFFAGVPVVASDWRYNSDIIRDKINGFIFKTQDDNAMEQILDEVYNKKYDLKSMQKNCLKEAKKYLPDVAIEPLINFIETKNNIKRLLCVVSSMERGGAETFLMKLYRQLDREKYQFDFCVSNPKQGFYDDEIKQLGGKIYLIPQKSRKPIASFLALKKIVKENRYKSVLRTSQQSLATLDLIAAKMGGATKLIYRSSNAGMAEGKFSKIINKIFSFLPKIVPNIKVAPSTEAATFVFGKKAIDKGKVLFLHNGLNYNDFRFDVEKRKKIREELGIRDKKVYGHIGRFNIQKNHMFLLEVFKNIYEKDNNSILILIGEGELRQQIFKKIEELNLISSVFILEPKKNVNEYLMAMDLFIFPSFFEGMPNVIIEAQATGLPCVISDSITKEANITGIVKYLDLNKGDKYWADFIMKNTNTDRRDYYEEFFEKKYCIEEVCDIACKNFF